jgi:hypothetical protein
MSSIIGLGHSAQYYQTLEIPKPNTDKPPRPNPLDPEAGDDAEVFDARTQRWQSIGAENDTHVYIYGDTIYHDLKDFKTRLEANDGWLKW